MSDDLVKILRADDGDWRTDQAADRIEELEAKALANRVVVMRLEAKLAKAVEALELADKEIMDITNDLDLTRLASVFDLMVTIRATLAELKGKDQ